MYIDPVLKAWIKSSNYATLLKRWNSASVSDPIFRGAVGDYYQKTMYAKAKKKER